MVRYGAAPQNVLLFIRALSRAFDGVNEIGDGESAYVKN